jgi:hypothetical protein
MSAVSTHLTPARGWRIRGDARSLSTAALVGLVLLSRLVGMGSGTLGALLGARRAGWEAFDPTQLSSSFGQVGNVLAAPFVRWDSIHYLEIARHGYTNAADTSFFPLYPLLTRGLSAIVGSDAVAGVLISLVAFAIALALVYRLTQRELDSPAAQAVVLLLAFAPLSFFFSAVYTESLFLALSVGAVYSARCERWGYAAALMATAALTRNTGILLIAPVCLMYMGRHGLKVRGLMLVVPSVVALAGFLFYLHGLGYGWLAPLKSEAAYGRQMIGPLAGLDQAVSGAVSGITAAAHGYRIVAPQASGLFLPGIEDLILLAVLVLSVLLLFGAWRKLPTPYFVYALLVLLTCLFSPDRGDPLKSLDRYTLTIFPLWMVAGAWLAKRRAVTPVLIVGAALMALYAYEFATWVFIA